MANTNARQNWRYFVLHGLFYSLKRKLAPPHVFLPFIAVAVGAPALLSAVIVPIFTLFSRGFELISAPIVSNAKQRKHYVSVGIVAIGMGLLFAIAAAEFSASIFTIACLVLSALVIGIGQGIGGVAYTSLLPSLFNRQLRRNLLNLVGVISAGGAIALAVATYYVFLQGDPLKSHLALIWLAVLMAIPAALLMLPVYEPVRHSQPFDTEDEPGQNKAKWTHFVGRFAVCWRQGWFRQYLIMIILLLSVRQVMPFYAIHASSLHKHQSGAFASLVVAMSIGELLSGPIIHRLSSRSVGTNMAIAILAAMTAAVIALMTDLLLKEPQFYYYMPVIVLVALASQIVGVSLMVYLGEVTDENSREYFVASSRTVEGGVGIAVTALLGLLIEIHNESVPIMIILGFNLAALVFVMWTLPEQERAA